MTDGPHIDDRSAAREALLAAAERLVAELGPRAVSARRLCEAAGLPSTAALTECFGGPEGATRAVLRQHSHRIDAIFARRLEERGGARGLAGWAECVVLSVVEHVDTLGHASGFGRLLTHVVAEQGLDVLDGAATATMSSALSAAEGRRPRLSPEARAARGAITCQLVAQLALQRELTHVEVSADGGPGEAASEVAKAIVAVWEQPDGSDHSEGAAAAPGSAWPQRAPQGPLPVPTDPAMIAFARRMRDEFTRFMMEYRFAVDAVLTKVSILREEFVHLHHYNPIEHVSSRVKKPESLLEKVVRKGCDPTLDAIRANIADIAGVRITCSFIADTYRILEALTSQSDIRVVSVRDYIADPKPNGYKSLHAIIELPIFLSDGPVPVCVEVQIRTVAMDFWASLEHKIYYKFDGAVPDSLAGELAATAAVAEQLDHRMEQLHTQVHGARTDEDEDEGYSAGDAINDALIERLWKLSRHTDYQ